MRRAYGIGCDVDEFQVGGRATSLSCATLRDMTILLAAPYSDLAFARAELSDWRASGLDVVEVPSPVSVIAFTRAVQQVQGAGLVIIAHGGPDGVLLDNAELLDWQTLAPLVRGRFEWLFINTCDSQPIADALALACGLPILCTVTDVPDKRAYTVGSTFAARLAEGYDFQQAAWLAKGTRGWKLVQPPDGDPFRRSYLAAA